MRKMMILTICVLVCATFVQAENWSQFLGENRDGKGKTKGLATRWAADGPKELWKLDVGPGFGGVAIRDGEVFILDRVLAEADVLRVLDLKTGKEKWKYRYEAEGRVSVHGSRSTPTVTDKYVYTVGGFGHLHCISRETHKPVWKLHLAEAYEAGKLNWGFAQSPLVFDGMVIVSPTKKSTPGLVALNMDTGEKIWESENFGGDYYSSPMVERVHGVQGIMLITNKEVTFVNPKDGKTIWQYDKWGCSWSIPAPTVMPDGKHVFITGGYGAGSKMIEVIKDGDEYSFKEKFKLERGSQLHPAIYHEGYLYANVNENGTLKRDARKTAGLACIDPKTGKIVWRSGEDPNFERGNLIMVNEKILIMDGEKGNLHLVNPSPKGYDELAKAKVLDGRGKKIWAPMALSDGYLVVRDQTELKCLFVGASTASK